MSKKDNQAAGRAAKASGDGLEYEIGLICDAYAQQGLAKIHKVDPPTRLVRQGKKVFGVQLPSPFIDWIGSWTKRGGRLVHLESKNTKEPRLGLLTETGLKPDQYQKLIDWDRSGATVGVLWGHRGAMKLISLPTIAHAIETGDKSLKWRHHRSCPRGKGFVTWDFLADLDDC
tara:strand:+ start:250 stop:768 length:519 start_codon:yes stop_codon:yes gene_type:complete